MSPAPRTVGVWVAAFRVVPAAEARPSAREIEQPGYDTIWHPEGLGTRESFTNAARVLADAWDDRFLLGLGVSHPHQVDPRGHRYHRPVAHMSAFLDAMDDDPVESPDAAGATRPAVPRVLAALRPPMLRLASEKALGAHTFLVPVEHTRRAREIPGPDALLIPEQKVILASGSVRGARTCSRRVSSVGTDVQPATAMDAERERRRQMTTHAVRPHPSGGVRVWHGLSAH